MKKLITTVGTSIFINYYEKNNATSTNYNKIKDLLHKDWDKFQPTILTIKKAIIDWAKDNPLASAEIYSTLKIMEQLKDNLEVYLIASDTIVSRLAAEIITEVFADRKEIKIYFNQSHDVISGLQVRNYADFVKEGLPTLVNRLEKIINSYPDNVVFNITGGYKGVIPYLTIIGQKNKCEIYYIFEETESLIKIPKTPISIDIDVFEKYNSELSELEGFITDYEKAKQEKYQAFNELESMGLVELYDEGAGLSPIGQIFYQSYKNQYFVFYCPDDVWEEIQNQKEIYRILSTKLSNEHIRENKTETKQSHYVYDHGNNPYRIYFFKYIDNPELFIAILES